MNERNAKLGAAVALVGLVILGQRWLAHGPAESVAAPTVAEAKGTLAMGAVPSTVEAPEARTPTVEGAVAEQARRSGRRAALQSQVDASDPELGQFHALAQKVVRTKDENDRLRALLASPAMIARAREDLSGKNEKGLDPVNEMRRMNRVDFLGMALVWKENPERERVRDTMMAVVRDADFRNHPEEELRKSLASDKIELVRSLGADDPAVANSLWDGAPTSGEERFLKFAVAYAMASLESK